MMMRVQYRSKKGTSVRHAGPKGSKASVFSIDRQPTGTTGRHTHAGKVSITPPWLRQKTCCPMIRYPPSETVTLRYMRSKCGDHSSLNTPVMTHPKQTGFAAPMTPTPTTANPSPSTTTTSQPSAM